MAKPLTFKQKAALKIAQAKSAAKRKGKSIKGGISNVGKSITKGKRKLTRAKIKLQGKAEGVERKVKIEARAVKQKFGKAGGNTKTLRAKLKARKTVSKVANSKVVRRGKGVVAGAKAGNAVGKRNFKGKASASENRNLQTAKANFNAGGKLAKVAIGAGVAGGIAAGMAGKKISKTVAAVKKSRTSTAKLRKSVAKKTATKKKTAKHTTKYIKKMRKYGETARSMGQAQRQHSKPKPKSRDPRR
jgi:hypothetical protein